MTTQREHTTDARTVFYDYDAFDGLMKLTDDAGSVALANIAMTVPLKSSRGPGFGVFVVDALRSFGVCEYTHSLSMADDEDADSLITIVFFRSHMDLLSFVSRFFA